MKCNPWRWLWGLIPILMLGWIAILGERERIERDLGSRAKVVLDRSGLGWAEVKFDGRDAVLSGKALEDGEQAKAVAAMLDTMGVRVVEDRSALVEKVDRFSWSAIRQDNRIRLDGLVPSDKVRRDLIGMAKSTFPNLEVDDRMKTARGVPPLDAWLGGVGFGFKQLAQLKQGRVDLEQMSLAVSGDALDARSYQAVMGALSGNLPKNVVLKSESVRPPLAQPYNWSARRQGDEVVLVGHVPNDTVRGELIRSVRRIGSSAKVVDRMEPASGAPEGFAGVATALLAQLAALEEGNAQIRDKAATLSGTTDTASNADKIKGTFGSGVLASFRTSGEIRHREPLIKTIQPYVTSARVEPGVVVLSGYVPDDKARGAVVSMAKQRFAGRQVRDELQLGAGQPQGWETCVEAGLDAVRRLDNGTAVLTGQRLVVAGTTDAEPLAQSLPADVRSRVGPSCDADVRIALDKSTLRARVDEKRRAEDLARQAAEDERRRAEAAERQAAADAERRRAEEAAARQSAADAERRRAEEAAARQAAADAERRRAEEAAARQAAADADRRRAEEAAARQAAADAERRRAEEAARVATAAPSREVQKAVDLCQQTLSQIAREGIINFKRASFDLEPSSFPTLNKLATAANQCPTLLVEIGGHTDAEGTPERNQLLSDRRANSVREYLTRAGVDASRLAAVGYGQDRNIAPNDTPENRAKNRRIEFIVKLR